MSSLSGRARATGQPRVIASGDHKPERTTWTEARDRRDYSELSREDRHDILQGMQDLHEDGPQL